VVMLRECEVMDTESKNNPERKLKVVSVGHKNKVLHLECASERQRNEWYEAIEKSINREKAALLKEDDSPNEADSPNTENMTELFVKMDTTERSENIGNKNIGIRLGDYDSNNTPGTPMSEELPYDDRYEYSKNFPEAEFKEFEPMDDTVSVSEFSTYDDFKAEARSNLGPFQNTSLADTNEKRKDFKIQRSKRSERNTYESNRLMKITEGEKEKDDGEDDASDVSSPLEVQSNERTHNEHQSKSSIIRHTSTHINQPKMPTATTKLVNISNITIRLNDFDYR